MEELTGVKTQLSMTEERAKKLDKALKEEKQAKKVCGGAVVVPAMGRGHR